jgi:hypothetical protein
LNLNPAVGWPKKTKNAERKEVLRQPPFTRQVSVRVCVKPSNSLASFEKLEEGAIAHHQSEPWRTDQANPSASFFVSFVCFCRAELTFLRSNHEIHEPNEKRGRVEPESTFTHRVRVAFFGTAFLFVCFVCFVVPTAL